MFSCNVADVVYVTVQSSGKVTSTEMVCRSSGQGEEEDHTRINHYHFGKKAENVLLLGMERLQNCLQEVGLVVGCGSFFTF